MDTITTDCRRFRRLLAGTIVLLAVAAGMASAAADEALPQPVPPEKAASTFQLPPGFEIRLVAAEPHLANPISLALDGRERVYVSLAHSYRYGAKGSPVAKPTNPVVCLELGADGSVRSSRVVLSDFSDPVMGLLVREDALWLTNLDRVLVGKIEEDGTVGALREILRDAVRPWNPFGMYRIKSGRDGLLYLSVGDHLAELSGPDATVKVRGKTGAVFRFRPDGSELEILIQGMRAPFSFDLDPFGDLRVLSNGEGNPNRLIHAIRGADYHFQTRSASWEWLAGKHPLSPPTRETPAGAHTEILRYFSSGFPGEYRGDLLVSNWGAHGFPSANHVVLRYFVDERGALEPRDPQPFLTTSDPRFRPTQMVVDDDGSLLVLDWYGQDDENDLTGRLYRISHVGSVGTPERSPASAIPGGRLCADETAGLLGHPHHKTRDRASDALTSLGAKALPALTRVFHDRDPLAAAEALWILRRSALPEARQAIEHALNHRDWRVRRLALALLSDLDTPPAKLAVYLDDPDVAVAAEAALLVADPGARVEALGKVLRVGAARSPRLRYLAALEISRSGREDDLASLLESTDADLRLAGLIALDGAFHETVHGARGDDVALRVLDRGLALEADRVDGRPILLELLSIAERWPDPRLVPSVVAALNRRVSAEEFARGIAVLGHLGQPVSSETLGSPLERFLADAVTGRIVLGTRKQKLAALEALAATAAVASSDAKDLAIRVLSGLVEDADVCLRAWEVLAVVGIGQPDAIDLCWSVAAREDASPSQRVDAIVTLSRIQKELCVDRWTGLLASDSQTVAVAALRCLPAWREQPEARVVLETAGSRFLGAGGREDYAFVTSLLEAEAPDGHPPVAPPEAEEEARKALRRRLVEGSLRGEPILGRLVYRTRACASCHSPAEDDGAPLGPSLDGVAATNSFDYLVDSILYPSKVVKTGFLTEVIVTRDGRVLAGKIEGGRDHLIVRSSPEEKTRVAMSEVIERRKAQVSIMPESLETTMSPAELSDLIAYLCTLDRTSEQDKHSP